MLQIHVEESVVDDDGDETSKAREDMDVWHPETPIREGVLAIQPNGALYLKNTNTN